DQPAGKDGPGDQGPFYYPDQWATLDVSLRAEPKPVAVTLRRVTLKGSLVGPDGQPVTSARMLLRRELSLAPAAPKDVDKRIDGLYLLGHGARPTDTYENRPVEVREGRFELSVHDLETTYRLLFLDAEHGLGAFAEFQGKQAEEGPVTIRLVPCGSATARFVDAQGKPLANYRPFVWAMLPPIHTPTLTDIGPMLENGVVS